MFKTYISSIVDNNRNISSITSHSLRIILAIKNIIFKIAKLKLILFLSFTVVFRSLVE